MQAFGGVLGRRAVGRQAAVLRVPWKVAVEEQRVVEQAEHVVGVVEWARESFGAHGLIQGRIATTGCCGSTGPERQAFVQRLFP